jgi:diguanylate cyclase (GGDEF)-like protein
VETKHAHDEQRQLTPVIPGVIVRYVARAHDRAAAEEVIRLAGIADAAGLLDETVSLAPGARRWFSSSETIALAEAATRVCGDEDLGRRAGEQLFVEGRLSGVADFLVAAGKVARAVDIAVEFGSKMSTGLILRVTEHGERHSVIEGKYADPSTAHPFYCAFTAGYFAQLPSLFGFGGTVTHPRCQFRGDDRCIFRVAWRSEQPDAGATVDVATSATRSEQQLMQFEQLQSMAGELVRAADVDDVLSRITARVGVALQAPRYLLAVRTADDVPLRVRHFGFPDDETATRYAERVLAGELDDRTNVLAVDVVSARRRFGRLAAVHVRGAVFTEVDRRLLGAYADHAAAALEVIASLDEARRDRDTARALLALARALAEVGTSAEISDRLARAVRDLAGSETASVWLWDETTDQFTLGGRCGSAAFEMREAPLGAGQLPHLAEWVANPVPVVVDRYDPASMSKLLCSAGLDASVAMPIVASGGAERELLLERLRGIAAHAAIALENARLIEDVRHQAMHDALTGLPNRPLVEDRANQLLRARSAGRTGLLFIDLDRFKNVNDTLGHKAGDELICAVAHLLQSAIREGDTLARLGGDEFVVLLPGLVDVEEAAAIAGRIIDALAQPLAVAGQQLFISCSIGVACAPDHGTDYGTLLQHADVAMYEAKALGRGRYAVHTTSSTSPRRMERLLLESQLHEAIARDELRVFYQPQVDLRTRETVGVEALVRWQHPRHGLLQPDTFVPLAEESGLIVEVDAWVRRHAFSAAARWASTHAGLRVAVNVSARDLMNPRFADELALEIREAGLDPALVELEITDRVALEDESLASAFTGLSDLGARLAIDDFGTGTSVLGRLHDWPLHTLKIDRRFVREVTEDSAEAPVLKAVIALARSLDLTVVAEGVETEAQLRMLLRYGCDVGQGFYFGVPAPAGDTAPVCSPLVEPAGV